ncbi:MAG: right-handed parallel beta-helix repeat-containing protein [Gemmataceae bacterium]
MIADTFLVLCPGCEKQSHLEENAIEKCFLCGCEFSVDSNGDVVVEPFSVTCPECHETCALGDCCEVQCWCCECQFCVDENGDVVEDDVDDDGNLEVDESGELCDDTYLQQLRCPRCSRPVEAGEYGEVTCPRCHCVFEATREPSVPPWLVYEERYLWEDFDPYGEHYDVEEYCPHCQVQWDECERDCVLALGGGFYECRECGAIDFDADLCDVFFGHEATLANRGRRRCVLSPDEPGNFRANLDSGLRRVCENGLLILKPGTYNFSESIQTRKLTLVGEGPPGSVIVKGPVEIEGSKLRIDGITFQGSVKIHHGKIRFRNCRFQSGSASGVQISGGTSRVLFEGCRIERAADVGLTTHYGTSVRMTRCAIINNEGEGVRVGTGAWVRLRECVIAENGNDGVVAHRGSRVFLHGCHVRDNIGDGIMITGGQTMLRKCQFTGHSIGVKFGSGTIGAVLSCQMTDNQTVGLQLEERCRAYLKDTKVQDNEVGIVLQSRAKVRIAACSVEGNRGKNWDVAEGGCVVTPEAVVRT